MGLPFGLSGAEFAAELALYLSGSSWFRRVPWPLDQTGATGCLNALARRKSSSFTTPSGATFVLINGLETAMESGELMSYKRAKCRLGVFPMRANVPLAPACVRAPR